jgi:hypothetical protein
MKKPHEIENWALSIIDSVEKNQPIEDSRIELKSTWIEPERAARRLAGHANASRGTPILWLIGVDEDKGIVGVNSLEFKTWFSKVKKCFDGLYPEVIDINIRINEKVIVCLYFLTERIPFVVKNPYFGAKNGGPVSLEVPWREGTEVKSASRNQLIQILSPLQMKPTFEIMNGHLEIKQYEKEYQFYLEINFYIEIKNDQKIQIPFHKCIAYLTYGHGNENVNFENIRMSPRYLPVGSYSNFRSTSLTIESTPDEVFINGSGRLIFTAELMNQKKISGIIKIIDINIEILPIGFDQYILFKYKFRKVHPTKNSISTFEYEM